jgi:hypothetical protein
MFEIASQKHARTFTKLHTDYEYSYSAHPNCILTSITKNLCARQSAIDNEVSLVQTCH